MILTLLKKYFILITIGLTICSCAGSKKIIYFSDLKDTNAVKAIEQQKYKELTIKPDDIISVTIQTIDPTNFPNINQAVDIPVINPNNLTTNNTGIAGPANGYLVDKDGVVELPMLGKIKLNGLTTSQARDSVRKKAAIFFKEPTVQVRFTNLKITVLGEVERPAPYIIPNEKVSVLDAIGLAGDLTVYGKRENVLLIRENNGKKEFYRFNLNSSETFKSPVFYLQQNDIIYVEGNKAKAASLNTARTQTYAIIGTIMSVFILLISRF